MVAIRVINLTTHNCCQQLNPVVYEWLVCECEDKEQTPICGSCASANVSVTR